MAREFKRTDRVAEQLQRELALIIQQQVKDPRVGMTTISAVEVSKDLQHAKVYVSFLNKDEEEEVAQALNILSQAAGFIRSSLAARIRMRAMPYLHFHYDASIAHGQEMSSLIDVARSTDSDHENSEEISN